MHARTHTYTQLYHIQILLCVFQCWMYIYEGLFSWSMKAFHGTTPLLETSADVTTSNQLRVRALSWVVEKNIWPPVEEFLMAFPSLCENAWCNESLFGNPLLDVSFHEWNLSHKSVRVIVFLELPFPPPWSDGLFIATELWPAARRRFLHFQPHLLLSASLC